MTEDWSKAVVQSWVSDGTRKEIRGLAVNEDVEDNTFLYTLREVTAPDGYMEAEEIRFKLVKEASADGELKNSVYVYDAEQKKWCLTEENTVVMKDKPETPEVPDRPKEPEEPKHHHSSGTSAHLGYAPVLVLAPGTGDLSQAGIYLGVIVLSLTAGGILIWRIRKKREH